MALAVARFPRSSFSFAFASRTFKLRVSRAGAVRSARRAPLRGNDFLRVCPAFSLSLLGPGASEAKGHQGKMLPMASLRLVGQRAGERLRKMDRSATGTTPRGNVVVKRFHARGDSPSSRASGLAPSKMSGRSFTVSARGPAGRWRHVFHGRNAESLRGTGDSLQELELLQHAPRSR